jgi:hypothetical protein
MKITAIQVTSGIIISLGVSLLVAGCITTMIPMIMVGLTLFLAGGLLCFVPGIQR